VGRSPTPSAALWSPLCQAAPPRPWPLPPTPLGGRPAGRLVPLPRREVGGLSAPLAAGSSGPRAPPRRVRRKAVPSELCPAPAGRPRRGRPRPSGGCREPLPLPPGHRPRATARKGGSPPRRAPGSRSGGGALAEPRGGPVALPGGGTLGAGRGARLKWGEGPPRSLSRTPPGDPAPRAGGERDEGGQPLRRESPLGRRARRARKRGGGAAGAGAVAPRLAAAVALKWRSRGAGKPPSRKELGRGATAPHYFFKRYVRNEG
jgi:translation initiation factor IF-2